ncbi:hypothetical protein HAX54_015727, partial [Datura stramonium]|nr:hypothetical protein [Datura stramonium]
QVNEMVVPADAEEIKPPEITSSKQVQTEWACALCQMTTTSEQSLMSHLNRRKHKAKSEGLKTCRQMPKSEGSSPVTIKSNQLNQQEVKDTAVPQSEQVKSVEENPIQIEKKTTGVQVKEMVVSADAEEIKPPVITSSKQVQTEWTCAVCQMTITSERSFISHLNGRKHKAKSDGPKTCKQMPKSEGSSPVTTESNQLNQPQVKDAAEARSEQSVDEAALPKQVKSVKEYPIQIEKKTTGVQVKEMVVPADAEEIKPPVIISSKQVQTEWTCAVCQITTTSEQSLMSHINGRKHKAKSEGPKTCKQMPNSEGSSPVTTESNQLNQQQVKDAAEARSEQSADEAAVPKQVHRSS